MTEALKKALETQQSILIAKKHLIHLEKRLVVSYQKLDQYTQLVEKEYQDIETLEKLNITSLFRKVLGNKEEQLEKERQDYLQAILLLKEQKKEVELLEFEQTILKEKIATAKEAEKNLTNLLLQQQQLLMRQGSAKGRRLVQLEKEIRANYLQKREAHEAIIAGTKALLTVDRIAVYLKLAVDYCEWQEATPGTLAALRQLGYVDKARALAPYAAQELQCFVDELEDINIPNNSMHDLDKERFLHFTEFLFDDLISDWIVLGKVQNAYYNTLASKDKLTRTIGNLKAKIKKLDHSINYLEERKNILVLESL